jgi:preprotein translocase subunit YajC
MFTISTLKSDMMQKFIAMGTPPAGQAADPSRGMAQMVLMIAIMLVMFYVIAIRPQQKQQKELKKMLDALKPGDKVLLSSGIFGIVSHIKDKCVVVKIAENTKVEVIRTGIQTVVPEETKETKEEKKN